MPDNQLSLAIGKEGKNARLAAKLTNCKIDIKPASQMMESGSIKIDLSKLDLSEKPAEETTVDPFITAKAKEVIAGKWGNGQARKDALAAWFVKAVQDEVNRLMGG